MAILANEKHSIGDLFNNRNPFIIPKHQRAYSWENDEIEAFCTDIKSISKEYFFGGVVSVHQLAQNGPGRTYRIVDGQQRIATFTLLIAQLKNGFNQLSQRARVLEEYTDQETAKSLADDLYETYLTYKDTKQRPPVRENRLTLSKIDLEYFKELLSNEDPEPEAESHKKLKHAWDTIYKKLIKPVLDNASLSVNEQIEKLTDLRDNILDQSVVIHIVCDNLDEAYQLFEVLNDRGKELAIGDYLRSTTLEILDANPGYQSRVSDCWDYLLSKKNADKYIRAYLGSHVSTIKKSNLHRQFQRKFFSYDGDVTNEIERRILHTVLNLKELHEVYELLIEGVWPYSSSTSTVWERQRLNLLVNQLEHKLCIPFLIAIYEVGNEVDFKEAVLATEKFVFRYITASNLRANRLSQLYKKYVVSIRQSNTFNVNDYITDLKELIDTHCKNPIFEENLFNNIVYKKNSQSIKRVRYFLTTLEDYYSWYNRQNRSEIPQPSMNVTSNIDSIDIEHIYPQNPTQREMALEPLKNTIGNLTFWSPNDNRSVGNAPFAEKLEFYSASNVSLTRELIRYTDWDEAALLERNRLYTELAKLVFNVYPQRVVN